MGGGVEAAVAWAGAVVGTFAGLSMLVFEMALIGRSMRRFARGGMQATLQSFTLRLAIVGSLGMWFMREGSGTDSQSFCLTFVATFFVYLCWLTWRVYNEPVQYRARPSGETRTASLGADVGSASAGLDARGPATTTTRSIEELLAAGARGGER